MIPSRTVLDLELPFSSRCIWLLAQEHCRIEYTCAQSKLCHLYTLRFLAVAEVDLDKHALHQNIDMMTCQKEGVRVEYFRFASSSGMALRMDTLRSEKQDDLV